MTTSTVEKPPTPVQPVRPVSLVARLRSSIVLGPVLALAVLGAGLAVPYVIRSVYTMSVVMDGIIMAILALSIGFLHRHLGLISLGQTAFFGASAYGVAIANTQWHWGPIASVLAGLGAGLVTAAVVGALVMRSSGIAFLMLTLALGLALYEVVVMDKTRELTGGRDGLLMGFDDDDRFLGLTPRQMFDDFAFWPVVWATFVVVVLVLWLLGRSRFGSVLHGIRENEERMRFSGYETMLPRFVAFVVAGVVASTAGVLSALNNGLVTDQMLSFQTSGHALVAAIIGGLGSLLGPIVGAGTYTYLQSVFSNSGNLELLTGLTLVVVLAVAPRGIVGAVADLIRLLRTGFATKNPRRK